MKVDYAAIIEKANERKERLQVLAIYTADIQEKYKDLEVSVRYFNDLIHKLRTLDSEGQSLIHKNIVGLLSDATNSVKQLTHGATLNEYARTPLKDLVNILSV